MAEDTNNPFEEEAPEQPSDGGGRSKMPFRIGLLAAVVGIGSAGGYGLGALFRGASPVDPNSQAQMKDAFEGAPPEVLDVAGEDFGYVEFEPIIANLNEPRLTRYIRAGVTLAISKGDMEAASKQIEAKKVELRNQLNAYLAGCSLDDVRGPKNINRIRREMLDLCNQMLWPKSRPMIDHVLFKEFTIQ